MAEGKVWSLRDIRITAADGRPLELGNGRVVEEPPAAGPGERIPIAPASLEIAVKLSPEAGRWLRYMVAVRPWLYCPVEHRLN